MYMYNVHVGTCLQPSGALTHWCLQDATTAGSEGVLQRDFHRLSTAAFGSKRLLQITERTQTSSTEDSTCI